MAARNKESTRVAPMGQSRLLGAASVAGTEMNQPTNGRLSDE